MRGSCSHSAYPFRVRRPRLPVRPTAATVATAAVVAIGLTAVVFGSLAVTTIVADGESFAGEAGMRAGLVAEKLRQPERILAAFDRGDDQVRVLVGLVPTAAEEAFDGWHDVELLDERSVAIARRVDAFLAELETNASAGDFRWTRRYDHLAALAGWTSRVGLERLLASDQVASVQRDEQHEADTRQGIPQIAASAGRLTYGGAGVSIAIADTGIDYTHPQLGGAAFPNAKVIGGYDFGDDDGDPMDLYNHGTPVAGIAAGDITDQGDFIGGVAPEARLYALKISFGSGGTAFTSDMIAAWDWCITHKYDDPSAPILAINTSFSDGLRYTTSCDGIDTIQTQAADNCAAAGIALFCSSGNGGYCDGIARPACISSAISVGAVYDAGLGAQGWCVDPASCVSQSSGCTSTVQCDDAAPVGDDVICYSNAAMFLDLLAPSFTARTASAGGGLTDFGGTSAATPYAAGAAAVVQSASRAQSGFDLDVDQLRTLLTSTGDFLTDPKSGLSTPRVHLDNALAALAPANDDCADAIAIGDGGTLFHNLGATTDGPDEPALCDNAGSSQVDADVWYSYTASCAGQVIVDTCDADFDTRIAVYASTSCPGQSSAIACNDDACGVRSIVAFDVLAGESYLIRVGGYLGDQGSGTLTVECRPDNDFCFNATPIGEGNFLFSNVNATTDGPAEPTVCNFAGNSQVDADVWFLYTATCNGPVQADICSADYDSKIAIYSGATCPSAASAIACDDDACGRASRVSFDAVAGQKYLVRIGGYLGAQGVGTLSIGCSTLYDDCDNAGLLVEGVTAFDNLGASTDGPDEPQACSKYGYTQVDSDIWFRYIASCTGDVTVSLCGSQYDTRIAAYLGPDCPDSASAIACNDDSCGVQSEITFTVVDGSEYLIRIGGYLGEQGTGTIELSCEPSAIGFCQGVDQVDTLRVNFDTGLASGYSVTADAGETLIFDIARPGGQGNGKFVAHLNIGAPTTETIQHLPASLGPFCFPALIADGANPACIWNSIGKEGKVGSSVYFGVDIEDPGRAPETFLLLPEGDVNFPVGATFTLQAVILNPSASSPKGASVTNAILLIMQ